MRVGFIGVGHIAQAMVEGLQRGPTPPTIVLSPRSRDRARALADRYDLDLASNNGEVVERSDLIVLATRPADILDAAQGLPWRGDQTVVSVAAGVPLSKLAPSVSPAVAVRAMPVTSARIGESATSTFPPHGPARAFLQELGPVVDLPSEEAFETAAVVGAIYAWFFTLAQTTAQWLAQEGVSPEQARQLATQAMRGAAGIMQDDEAPLEALARGLATPGGITAAGLDVLHPAGLECWRAACDAALARLREN